VIEILVFSSLCYIKKKKNLITGIVKSNDNIGPLIMNYFMKLLTSEVHVPDIGVLS
jgi:hypothetical protein